MAIDSQAPRSRRAILGAAVGGLGAVVASRYVSPEKVSANAGDAVLVDGAHTGAGTTSVTTSATSGAAIAGVGVAQGLFGSTATGSGVWGVSTDATPSDFTSGRRAGVIGVAGNETGIATSTDESGVYGFSNISTVSAGVWGDSVDANGVVGTGSTGVFGVGYYGVYAFGRVAVTGEAGTAETGVYGFAGAAAAPLPPAGVAVQATAGSTSQIALNVTGRAKFSRSARTSISAGSSSRRVTMAGVTTSSYIIATLQTRRTGVYVHAVVPASGYFVIYLNKAVSATTYVGYLVIN